MAVISKLLAISSLLVLSASALDSNPHRARAVGHHAGLAKRRADVQPPVKRKVAKRCKSRPPPPPADNSGAAPPADNGGAPPPANNGGSPPPADNGGGGNTSGGTGGNTGGGSGGNTGGSPGGPSASGKRGLAWPNGPDDVSKWAHHKATWMYSWDPLGPGNAAENGFEFVPMLWGPAQEADFVRVTSQDGFARHALLCNEPNQHDQANLSVDDVISLYWRAVAPLKSKGYRIGSAAPTSAPNGFDWIAEFEQKCQGCTDFLALHWYDVDPNAFIAYMEKFHNAFNKNIWVTEFACQNFNGGPQCTEDQIYDFLGRTMSWMEATPWIERYAVFGTLRYMYNVNPLHRMMNDDGTPNALGWYYLDSN